MDPVRAPAGQALSASPTEPVPVSALPGNDPSRVDILAPRGCDEEVASIMDQLNRLQGWLVLKGAQARGDPEFMAAGRLVQDTRVLIVERCFKRSARGVSDV